VEALLAWMVVLLLVGPPLLVILGGLLLVAAAVAPGGSRRLRETFWCPWGRRMVTADFLVAEGEPHPTKVLACSAFRNPKRVQCKQACRDIADVHWGLPRGVFPRWALTAGGVVTWRTVAEPAVSGSR